MDPQKGPFFCFNGENRQPFLFFNSFNSSFFFKYFFSLKKRSFKTMKNIKNVKKTNGEHLLVPLTNIYMMKELIRLFRQFLIEKKEERLKANLIKNWCKDENYEAAAELFKIFTDSNSDVVMEIDVPSKFKIRIFRDVEGKVREERLTEDELFLGRRG